VSLAVLVLSPALVSLAFANAGRSFVIKTLSLGDPGWENGAPSSIAINPETNLVYVANSNLGSDDPNNIIVINSTSNEVVGSINVGRAVSDVVVNPTTGTIYSANSINTVSAINGTTNEVIATFDYSDYWEYIETIANVALNSETNKVYVLLITDDVLVSVIDGATNKIESTFKVADLHRDYDVIGSARAIAVNPVTNMVYVANDYDSVIVIDGSDNHIVDKIDIWGMPDGIAVNRKTNTVYVSDYHSQSLYMIDGATNEIIGTVTPFFSAQRVEVDEERNAVYVTTHGDGLVVMDGKSLQIRNRIGVGQFPGGVALNPSNSLLYVSNGGSNSISVIRVSEEKEWQTTYAVGKFLYSEPPKPDQLFKVQYRVINGTAEKFVAQPFGAAATVDAEGNGLLEIMYPRNYPYTNDISGTDVADPLFLVNDLPASPLEKDTTTCFFKFSIPFKDKSDIELAWAYLAIEQFYYGDYVFELCLPDTLVLETLTPVQQSRAGVQPQNIICPEDLLLVIDPTYKPYCATPASAEMLKERWK
jgi:DNA-binding beta-propeller fold protein YncE